MNVFDEMGAAYEQLQLLRYGTRKHWPPGGGSRNRRGPGCLISPDIEDLLSEFEALGNAGKRLLRESKRWTER